MGNKDERGNRWKGKGDERMGGSNWEKNEKECEKDEGIEQKEMCKGRITTKGAIRDTKRTK